MSVNFGVLIVLIIKRNIFLRHNMCNGLKLVIIIFISLKNSHYLLTYVVKNVNFLVIVIKNWYMNIKTNTSSKLSNRKTTACVVNTS